MKKKTSPEILSRTLQRLIAQYGQKAVRDALDVCELTAAPKKKLGHPQQYEIDQMMAVLLYVKEGIARRDCSVKTFCDDRKTSFQWLSIGANKVRAEKTIKGDTLRRRYHQATAYLEENAKPYRALTNGSLGIKMGRLTSDGLSPLERYLKKELDSRLSRKVVR